MSRFHSDGHVLVIEGTYDTDEEDWDITARSIRCPHEPFPSMPCASYGDRCGCEYPSINETPTHEAEVAILNEAENRHCPKSPTGRHLSFEGEYLMPSGECYLTPWPVDDFITDGMWNLKPGEYPIGWCAEEHGPEIQLAEGGATHG